jgi:hypothetical protein
MFACARPGGKRRDIPITLKSDPPSHFWEAWRVEADGTMSPSNQDTWVVTVLPDTEGDWRVTGKAFWTPTLDAAAGFAPQPWNGGQLSTLTQPTGLGPALLTRDEAGTWNCCS